MLYLALQDISRNFRKGYCIIRLSYETLDTAPDLDVLWKATNIKINKVHKRALLNMMDFLLIFLSEVKKRTVRNQNLQKLMV